MGLLLSYRHSRCPEGAIPLSKGMHYPKFQPDSFYDLGCSPQSKGIGLPGKRVAETTVQLGLGNFKPPSERRGMPDPAPLHFLNPKPESQN